MRDIQRRIGRLEAGVAEHDEPPTAGLASLLAWSAAQRDLGADEEEKDWESLRHASGLAGAVARHYRGDDDAGL